MDDREALLRAENKLRWLGRGWIATRAFAQGALLLWGCWSFRSTAGGLSFSWDGKQFAPSILEGAVAWAFAWAGFRLERLARLRAEMLEANFVLLSGHGDWVFAQAIYARWQMAIMIEWCARTYRQGATFWGILEFCQIHLSVRALLASVLIWQVLSGAWRWSIAEFTE